MQRGNLVVKKIATFVKAAHGTLHQFLNNLFTNHTLAILSTLGTQAALQSITNELNAVKTFVTVADGLTSFGDFNTDDFADFTAAMQAAVDSVPAGQTGVIMIKRGAVPYDVGATSVDLTAGGGGRRLRILGEGPSAGASQVQLRATGTAAVFSGISDAGNITEFENLDFGITGSANNSVTVGGAVFAKNCTFERYTATGTLASTGAFDNCKFTASTTT